MTQFILEEEKKNLRKRCYMYWLEVADGDSLVKFLFQESLISEREKQKLDHEKISQDKNGMIFEDVLKLTKDDFAKVIIHLDRPAAKNKDKEFARIFKEELFPNTSVDVTDAVESNLAEPCSPAATSQASGDESALFGSKKKKPSIEHYSTKEMSTTGCGKGICFIIANYTNDLGGYRFDKGRIHTFFEKTLHCTVKTSLKGEEFENLTKEKFEKSLESIRDFVEMDGTFDRFYLFVLSHGIEDGILMCKPDGISPDLDENQQHKKLSTDTIVEHFLHDKMKSMKGLPKLLFFQACRGLDIINAAVPNKKKSPELWKMPSEKIAMEADIMICYATTPSYLCWVGSFGSWFVNEVLEALKKYHASEDVGVIMRVVKQVISRKTSQVDFEEDSDTYEIEGETGGTGYLKEKKAHKVVAEGKVSSKNGKKVITVDARQMPTVMDNLTKKFYLTISD